MTCPPRFGTPRRPERATSGPVVDVVARQLGHELMGWQRHVVDVAGEMVDGLPVYSTVIVAAPRRAGKTLLTLAVLLGRAMTGRRRRAWYTAQSRADAALDPARRMGAPHRLVTARCLRAGAVGERVGGCHDPADQLDGANLRPHPLRSARSGGRRDHVR